MDKWDERFMQMADLVSTWASCYQPNRKIGAVIVKNKRVMTTGYNGAPAGVKTCIERGECLRRKLNIPSGQRQELCYAVHAEQNAIIQAAKLGISIDLAMVTPSLVMSGLPYFLSSTTLRPLGPRVILTVSARAFMPASRERRASSPY